MPAENIASYLKCYHFSACHGSFTPLGTPHMSPPYEEPYQNLTSNISILIVQSLFCFARKGKMMNKKRKHQITFRLSDEEYLLFKKKLSSSGYNQQEFLRRAALGKDITNMDAIKEILPEMKKQGVNLNQIAKRLNERGYVDYDTSLHNTLQEVSSTWQSLKQFLATHR